MRSWETERMMEAAETCGQAGHGVEAVSQAPVALQNVVRGRRGTIPASAEILQRPHRGSSMDLSRAHHRQETMEKRDRVKDAAVSQRNPRNVCACVASQGRWPGTQKSRTGSWQSISKTHQQATLGVLQ